MIQLSFEQKEEIGLKYVRNQLEPASPYGVLRLKEEGFYGPADQEALEGELGNVALLLKTLEKDEAALGDIAHEMSYLKDLRGSLNRCAGEALNEVELFEMTALIRRVEGLREDICGLEIYNSLYDISLRSLAAPLMVLDPGQEGHVSFYIEDSRSPALAAARSKKKKLEKALRQEAGDRTALLEARQEAAREEEAALEAIYAAISQGLRPYLTDIIENLAALGRLDGALAKARLAKRYGCIRPHLGGGDLMLDRAVHPQIRASLQERGREFTPISLDLPRGASVLTGANMGGKSVALKTVVLNAALALSGCFVFAAAARIPFFTRIELINRDFSNASQGLSSFGGELLRLKECLDQLSEDGFSLIIMDELARGTNAQEGERIAAGVVRYLADKPAITLLATHYDSAAAHAARHYQVKGLATGDGSYWPGAAPSGRDGLRLIENAMDYGLISVDPGTECPRDAIAICRLLGLPEAIWEGTAEGEKS